MAPKMCKRVDKPGVLMKESCGAWNSHNQETRVC